MFWKKKGPASPPVGVGPSSTPPRPILKTSPDNSGGPSIRFAGQPVSPQSTIVATPRNAARPPPINVVPQSAPLSPVVQGPISPQYSTFPAVDVPPAQVKTTQRRSSRRPTSPNVSSFGARVMPMAPPPATPPMVTTSHITTPPTAYVSTMQSRAPPPPSPFRPTISDRRPIAPLESLPMNVDFDLAPRPPRSSSLGSPGIPRSSVSGVDVPMLNIIPATPDLGEGFTQVKREPRGRLEEAAELEMVEMTMESEESSESCDQSMPCVDVKLDFSPFEALRSFPSSSSFPMPPADCMLPPTEPLPPSPTFESYPSLPSLSSHVSMPSSDSEDSMSTSSSVMSFSDVEEALGSMLASLSFRSSLTLGVEATRIPKSYVLEDPSTATLANPGLGLGLELPLPASITAPLFLSPRKRPPPLDLCSAKYAVTPEQKTAPPVINHRVAFYRSARAHPNSPTSGEFQASHTPQRLFSEFAYAISPSASFASSRSISSESSGYGHARRDSLSSDSISIASEGSDDDLHTASIISLTPVTSMGGLGMANGEVREEFSDQVGLAL